MNMQTFDDDDATRKPDAVSLVNYSGMVLPASAHHPLLSGAAEGLRRSPRRRLSAELNASEPPDSAATQNDASGGVHQLSSSPPRYATQRSTSSCSAQETQKVLAAGSDNFRQHMLAQHWIHNKVIDMLSALVVASARTIAHSLAHEGSLFQHIAANCPLEADETARSAMGQFVEANVAALAEELRPEIERLTPLAEGDVCHTGVLQILIDTRETLRQLVKFIEVRDRRNATAVHQFRAYRRTMTRQFDTNFDMHTVADFVDALTEDESVCCVCDEPFTVRHGPRACVKPKCCSLRVCVTCFNKYTFNSSKSGCLPTAMCMLCRAPFPVYARLDEPPTPALGSDDMNED